MATTSKFKEGDRVWLFDTNRRVYRDRSSSPVYECHYVLYRVMAVNHHSYHIRRDDGTWVNSVGRTKAEKTYLTDREMDDDVWENAHRHRIRDLVNAADAETLRRVAEVVGFRPGGVTVGERQRDQGRVQ